jgi:hypothetical protein
VLAGLGLGGSIRSSYLELLEEKKTSQGKDAQIN